MFLSGTLSRNFNEIKALPSLESVVLIGSFRYFFLDSPLKKGRYSFTKNKTDLTGINKTQYRFRIAGSTVLQVECRYLKMFRCNNQSDLPLINDLKKNYSVGLNDLENIGRSPEL